MAGLHDLKTRICSFENLMGAYRDAAKGKRYRNEVINFSFNLAENLLSIQQDLLNMTYKVGPYREFYVRYPKPRLVMALGFRDRIVQWAIYRQINPYLDKRYISHSYGCREGKGTLAAAEKLLYWQQKISRKPDADDYYLIKGDVSKYFYRVDHEKAVSIYEDNTDDEWFVWLISTIINNPDVPFGLPPGMRADDCPRWERLFDVGMPIGNLTSQETANLYLDRLDQFVKHTLHVHEYERYMDDYTLIVKGKERAWEIFHQINGFLKAEMKLDASPKCRIQKATMPVEYVGYIVSPHGLRLRKKTTQHIKRSLKRVELLYAYGIITLDRALQAINSYKGMCKHCNGYNLLVWIEQNIVLQRKEGMPDGEHVLPYAERAAILRATPARGRHH